MAEILALRQQLAILNRTTKRPSLRFRDRLFWIALARFWQSWRSALLIVKPETVIKWHRQGFRLYWGWKSKARHPGRPRIDAEIRDLIRRLSEENPLWGTPRIQAELHLLGLEVAESTVAKYRIKSPKPSSQTWKTFLSNHAGDIIGIDFFTVPTATFRNLYCFIILLHERRQVVHFNVTEHPTAAWTAQQMIEAFPEDTAPRFLLRDRDSIYGNDFRQRVTGIRGQLDVVGVELVPTTDRQQFQPQETAWHDHVDSPEWAKRLISEDGWMIGESHALKNEKSYWPS